MGILFAMMMGRERGLTSRETNKSLRTRGSCRATKSNPTKHSGSKICRRLHRVESYSFDQAP